VRQLLLSGWRQLPAYPRTASRLLVEPCLPAAIYLFSPTFLYSNTPITGPRLAISTTRQHDPPEPPTMSRDHRSASLDHDEEEDYQLAMRLSAAANGGQLPFRSAAPSQATHLHGDFELAMKMQFGAGNYRSNITAAFAAEPSPWVGEGKNQAKKAIYHAGTPSGKVSATLTAFLAHVKAAQCSGCGELFFSSKSDISTMLSKWREDEGNLDPLGDH
jgi:hypothetical protein